MSPNFKGKSRQIKKIWGHFYIILWCFMIFHSVLKHFTIFKHTQKKLRIVPFTLSSVVKLSFSRVFKNVWYPKNHELCIFSTLWRGEKFRVYFLLDMTFILIDYSNFYCYNTAISILNCREKQSILLGCQLCKKLLYEWVNESISYSIPKEFWWNCNKFRPCKRLSLLFNMHNTFKNCHINVTHSCINTFLDTCYFAKLSARPTSVKLGWDCLIICVNLPPSPPPHNSTSFEVIKSYNKLVKFCWA